MEMDFVTLTQENLDREQLCCIVRTKKPHPGVERKRAWLRERIREGHVFRKLTGNDCAFIEYGTHRDGVGAGRGSGLSLSLLPVGAGARPRGRESDGR